MCLVWDWCLEECNKHGHCRGRFVLKRPSIGLFGCTDIFISITDVQLFSMKSANYYFQSTQAEPALYKQIKRLLRAPKSPRNYTFFVLNLRHAYITGLHLQFFLWCVLKFLKLQTKQTLQYQNKWGGIKWKEAERYKVCMQIIKLWQWFYFMGDAQIKFCLGSRKGLGRPCCQVVCSWDVERKYPSDQIWFLHVKV